MELTAFEELTVSQLFKKCTAFCGISKLITVFTKALFWSLYWTK